MTKEMLGYADCKECGGTGRIEVYEVDGATGEVRYDLGPFPWICEVCDLRAVDEARAKWRDEIVWHNGRRWRFTLDQYEHVVEAWIEVAAAAPIRNAHWRRVKFTKAMIAAANANGFIVEFVEE